MDFGISIFVTDEMPAPGEIGRLVEERGFGAMFVAEHPHMPRDTVRDVERKYYRSLDPFVTLTAVAATTSTLGLGFGIMLLPQRDPITTAKAIASLDVVSGGRVEVGLGAGWNVPEIENHGTPFGERFGVMRERAEAMKAIWENDEATYHGRYVNFDRIWCWPKSAQKPHPPVIVGGNGESVLERVVAFGDEWMPNQIESADELEARIAKLAELAAEAGRPTPKVGLYAARARAETVVQYEDIGIARYVFFVPSVPRSEAEARLDHLVEVIEESRAAGT